ncbi:MAG: hypothetical protein JWM16_2650 [Verrucomicrobiales bacterium]|nr:hypothetical protein [Verrucomicrobiales bacterium]
MTFLPIVGRELRVASRQRHTYWTRIGAGLGGIGIGGWILLMPWFRGPQIVGPALFVSLSVLTFAYALLVGVLKTADCLSEEKREGTLGLLFLTDLKGYDIVLGKLTATSLNAFYGLLAIFPVMAIPLLAGGVSGKELTRVIASSLVTLFFSLSVGMFCSAISRDDRRAIVLSLLMVLFVTAGLPAIGGAVASRVPGHSPNPVFFVPSPGYACFMAFDGTFNGLSKFNFFWESIVTVHVVSWLLLITSCVVVPRTWQDKAANSEKLKRRQKLQRSGLGRLEAVHDFRTRLLEVNPIYWLSSRDRLKPLFLWVFLLLGVILWIWGLAIYPQDWKRTENYFMTAFVYIIVLKYWIALEAGRLLGIDRKIGALELLLSTPLSVKRIIQGHLMALVRLFAGPVLVVVGGIVIFAVAAKDESGWVRTCTVGIISFVADILVLGPLALWLGMVSKSTGRAAASAVVRVMVLPWMVFAALIVLLELRPGSARSSISEVTIIHLWLGISLVLTAGFGIWAWRKLHGDLRVAATRQYSRIRVRGEEKPQPVPPPLEPAAAK